MAKQVSCPNCGSTDVEGNSDYVGGPVFWKCNNCASEWKTKK